MNFFNNQVVIGWIAPIITTVLIPFVGKLMLNRHKTKETITSVTVANSKIMDSVRPLFIKKFVEKKLINDITNAIALEYNLKPDMLININQIREKLIYEITATRFMDDNEKIEAINKVYENFSLYEEDSVNVISNIINQEKNNLIKINNKIFIVVMIMLLATFSPFIYSNCNYIINFIINNNDDILIIFCIIIGILTIVITLKSQYDLRKK